MSDSNWEQADQMWAVLTLDERKRVLALFASFTMSIRAPIEERFFWAVSDVVREIKRAKREQEA